MHLNCLVSIFSSEKNSKFHADNQIAGWNEYCEAAHAQARDDFMLWVVSNKPRHGPLFICMKTSRAHFKLCLRRCKAMESRAQADSLARKLLGTQSKQFWNEIKKLNGGNSIPLAFTVDNITGQKDISSMWKDHYKGILNSIDCSDKKQDILQKLSSCENTESPITTCEVFNAIKSLKSGKACGKDGIQAEHLKFSSAKIAVLLSLLFNSMILHGHMCNNLMESIIIPIVKDKKGDITCKENYRPIAITTVISKLFEGVLLTRYKSCLATTHNQFGFKSQHSTDMCVFVLKNVIDYYTYMSSPVFICYLDASKAFDRLNYWVLFDKLLAKNVPTIIVRLLMFWYTRQQFIVQWGASTSAAFSVGNGVRQGGVLSPYLFNVYMDDLSQILNSSCVGCLYNGKLVNHLMYADDAALIAPSARALQKLLLLCETYAANCDIIFNVRKTILMCIKPKKLKNMLLPIVHLNGIPLKYVSSQKYLGVKMCDSQRDDDDIIQQLRGVYTRGNMLIKNFSQCSVDVKCQLFKSYCSSFYCSQLWHSYSTESIRRLKVAYNRIFRILLKLEQRVSISHSFIVNNVDHFDVLMRKNIEGFSCRVSCSKNELVNTVVHSFYFLKSKIYTCWGNKLYLNFNIL